MNLLSKKGLAVGLTAAALVLGSSIPASAVSLDSSMSGAGFISRGNVISHPDLGKSALVLDPVITLTGNGAHYTQTCVTTVDPIVETTYLSGDIETAVVSSMTRVAKGNGKVTGYKLLSVKTILAVPDTLCPTGSVPVEGTGGVVTMVEGTLPLTLTFTTGSLSGSWIWNTQTMEWEVLMD